jgi:hypothetical protein
MHGNMTLLEQIKSQPKKRKNVDVGMLGVSNDALAQLRETANVYHVPMGRIAEIAIVKLIAEINLSAVRDQ